MFSSKISNFIEKTIWALNGTGLASTGPDPSEVVYPYERILNWGPERDIQKFRKAWVELNTKYSEIWPNITKKREQDVPPDAEKWNDVPNKMEYFSEKPGKGD